MKLITTLIVLMTSLQLLAQVTTEPTAKTKKRKIIKIETHAANEDDKNPALSDLPKKPGEPCETKEDILKKLEEEKKKQKAFSLQGGNTGCSVDKK